MANVVVYKAHPSGADEVMRVLRSARLHPTRAGNTDPNFAYGSRWTNKVSIAVPADERERAVRVLSEWENDNTSDAARIARRFERRALAMSGTGVLGAGLAAGVLYALGGGVAYEHTWWLILAGGAAFAAMGVVLARCERRK